MDVKQHEQTARPPSALRTVIRRNRTGAAALRDGRFRAFFTSQACSGAGDSVAQLVMPLAALHVGRSALTVGLVVTAYGAARVATLPFGGLLADAVPRRRVLVATEAVKSAAQWVVAVLLFLGRADVATLVGGAIAYGLAYGFGLPAATGVLPQLVRRNLLHEANALLSVAKSGAQIGGLALSGVAIAVLAPGFGYLLAGCCYLASTGALVRLRLATNAWPAAPPFLKSIVDGWSAVVRRPWYWVNLVTHGLWNMSFGAFLVVGPLIATRWLGGAASWSVVSIAVSVGGLCGGVLTLRVVPRRPLVASNLVLGLAALPFVAFAAHLSLPATFVCTAIAFVSPTFLNVIWGATLQERIPGELLSRLSSYDWLVSYGLVPVGSALAGWSVTALGMNATLAVAAGLALTPGAMAVLHPAQRRFLRQDNESPAVHVPGG